MKAILLCFVLLGPIISFQKCLLINETFSCNSIEREDFLYEFHSDKQRNETQFIEIIDSTFCKIGHFPSLIVGGKDLLIKSIKIVNSSVMEIDNLAFKNYIFLEYLSINRNPLRNVNFFGNLSNTLISLDLSHCKIEIFNVKFDDRQALKYLNLSYNNLHEFSFDLYPYFNKFIINSVDLSYNNLKKFNISSCIKVNNFNLSYNELNEYSSSFKDLDTSQQTSIILTGNNLTKLENVKIDELDLSSTFVKFTNDIFGLSVFVRKLLKLNNNKLDVFHESDFDIIKQMFIFLDPIDLDLSNSSLEQVFFPISNHDYGIINLSYNPLRQLKIKQMNIFALDLSWTYISTLDDVFSLQVKIQNLFLSNSNLKKITLRTLSKIDNLLNVDLSYNPITTIYRYSFEHCNHLKYLNISNTKLSLIEDEAFNGLLRLEYLDLRNNLLTSINSQAFMQLVSLKLLKLQNNQFKILQTKTFSDISVRELILNDNKIKTLESDAFYNVSLLKNLNLSNMGIESLGNGVFNNMHTIEIIDLSNNNITVIPEKLFQEVFSLKSLYLHNNNIISIQNNSFNEGIELENLTLQFFGAFKSRSLMNLYRLNTLYFVNSNITVLENDSFFGLYNLKHLCLNNTTINNVQVNALKGLFNLIYLDSQNLFKFTPAVSAGMFKDLNSLEQLNLSDLALTYVDKFAFIGLNRLENLSLSYNNLTQFDSHEFSGLNSLQNLDLSNNILKNIYFAEELPSLMNLYLNYNNFSTLKSNTFEKLNNLINLHLDYNNMNVIDQNAFVGLKNLEKLYLQHNNLSELYLGTFQFLSNLKELHLEHNRVKVFHEGVFSNLRQLQILNLTNNHITILDVEIFFPLRNLQILHLEYNHIIQMNEERLVGFLKKIKYIGVAHNKWKCDELFGMLNHFQNNSIEYFNEVNSEYYSENINGISCIDICKFVFCETFHPTNPTV